MVLCQGLSNALVPLVPCGVELVSRATHISRMKRNRETCWRQSKALKRVQREAKRKFVAQREISHEAAEATLRGQARRTDEKFPGIVHVSHQFCAVGQKCPQFSGIGRSWSLNERV